LTRSFSDQGVRIRIRKEPRSSSSNNNNNTRYNNNNKPSLIIKCLGYTNMHVHICSTTSSNNKRRRKTTNDSDDDDDDDGNSSSDQNNEYMETSPMPRSIQKPRQQHQSQPQTFYTTATTNNKQLRSPSPLPHYLYDTTAKAQSSFDMMRPTLPSPKEIFRASPMSMQNILTNDKIQSLQQHTSSTCSQPLFSSVPANNNNDHNIFTTRKLPLPSLTTQPQPLPLQEQQQQLHNNIIHHHHITTTTSPPPLHHHSSISTSWLYQRPPTQPPNPSNSTSSILPKQHQRPA
jgi:hypothetical protein